ncbi:glycosyltransferase family 4 protein [Bacillus sp. 1P02SD]|uniref:glycosyltransferase family 4 protein n=1 Tax=Bacillus sp. 1P02SD TaxID=3132264 RepID=UPI0039A3E16B
MQRIAILHSGNLKDVSPGGVSEYVKQFIEHSTSEVFVLGTDNKQNNLKLFKKYKIQTDHSSYTFIPINYTTLRPLSVFYFINLIVFFILNPRFLKKISVFYAQRMEYVIPFLLFNKQVVMAIHGSGRYATMFWGKTVASIYSFLERISIVRSNKVFVLNNNKKFGTPYYKSKFYKQKDKIFYMPVPVNRDVFKPLDKATVRKKHNIGFDDKIILYLGRIDHNPKRVLLFPQILLNVKQVTSNTKMLIIGTGNDKDELIREFDNLGLKNNVIFYEYLEHGNDLVELINCAEVSIITSSFEGICMSALESLSCGIPVVATDVGSISEYLLNGINGFVVSGDGDELIVQEVSEKIDEVFSGLLAFDHTLIDRYNANEVMLNTEKLLLNR